MAPLRGQARLPVMPRQFAPLVRGRVRTFCCHSATLSGSWPANSLAAVRECLAADVARLEVDVRFVADDSMVVFHDRALDGATTGAGLLAAHSRQSLRPVRYRGTAEPLCFLEDVVDALAGTETVLQVDLKGLGIYTARQFGLLVEALAPIRDQVVAGSQAHWNVRPLAAAGIPVALDPTLHWHFSTARTGGDGLSPRSLGRHGLWDDSPLAQLAGVGTAQYFAARVEDLLAVIPAVEWMVDVGTLFHIESLGMRLGDILEARGVRLAAWTLHDEGEERNAANLQRLFDLGAEVIITDAPSTLAELAATLG